MSSNFPFGYCVFVFFPEDHLMVDSMCSFINFTSSDITQAAEDQLGWEYLHHRNCPERLVRVASPEKNWLFSIVPHASENLTWLVQKETYTYGILPYILWHIYIYSKTQRT